MVKWTLKVFFSCCHQCAQMFFSYYHISFQFSPERAIYLLSLNPYSRERLFLDQNFEMKILMDLHVLRSPESKNHTFSVWSVCTSVRVSVISIIQKQITAETSNLVFYFCIKNRCFLELFVKIGQKLCVQGHTKEI